MYFNDRHFKEQYLLSKCAIRKKKETGATILLMSLMLSLFLTYSIIKITAVQINEQQAISLYRQGLTQYWQQIGEINCIQKQLRNWWDEQQMNVDLLRQNSNSNHQQIYSLLSSLSFSLCGVRQSSWSSSGKNDGELHFEGKFTLSDKQVMDANLKLKELQILKMSFYW
ncbi:hypothetical protein L0B53_05185 [Vibrio sp. SS-MA-C1-2]|uniref:hypothetical protein n=1 Tax=Vibrio sp. SS-MA-C1-2 TaxID=2908646 RepID=UPI001F3E3A2A|nr:hypothetical protein [Vibrio sp. SS-MA-C1-2]UJF18994.1 hypothetical protein L0B53_05185 [Vibrio sp. SS-MA-C1-2]